MQRKVSQNVCKKCGTCRWRDYCAGLSEERRIACADYEHGNCDVDWQREASRRWGEMSYYQRSDRRNTATMQERLRAGE